MSVLRIVIQCDNEAFGNTVNTRAEEVSRILLDLAKKIRNGSIGNYANDSNGNRVCQWGFYID